jgi:hypothetical protein
MCVGARSAILGLFQDFYRYPAEIAPPEFVKPAESLTFLKNWMV